MQHEDGILFTDHMVKLAISRIKEFCPPEGYHLAFSGGKCSSVVARLARMAGVKYTLHFGLTTVDPPEVLKFVREHYPETVFHRPERSMWKLIIEKGIPPTRKRRYCCEALKEYLGAGEVVMTGIRWAESPKRRKRTMHHACLKDKTKIFAHVIIDWLDGHVWDFIESEKIPYCRLYDEGYKRIGCIMCSLASVANRERDAERFPGFYRAYIKTFDRMLQARKDRGLKVTTWHSGEDVMDWWMMRNQDHSGDKPEPEPLPLFS